MFNFLFGFFLDSEPTSFGNVESFPCDFISVLWGSDCNAFLGWEVDDWVGLVPHMGFRWLWLYPSKISHNYNIHTFWHTTQKESSDA